MYMLPWRALKDDDVYKAAKQRNMAIHITKKGLNTEVAYKTFEERFNQYIKGLID